MRYIITSLLYIYTFSAAQAQISFKYDQSIPVRANGQNPSMPWAGGMNSVQYNSFDLNEDGIEDLVLFDRTSNKVSTYLTEGNDYIYVPDYESYFPEGMTNWIIMRDYDCDGKKDIFTSSTFGVTLFKNISDENELKWEIRIDPVTTLGTGSIINLKINGSDIPAIEDIDGDGDLDILMFGFNGGGLQYHQNFSIERTGNCEVPDFERITTSWGGFSECGCGVFAFSGQSCRSSGGRQQHVGGKSLLAYDMDADGDMDIVIGEEDCNTLYLLENKGTNKNPIIDSFSIFPNNDNPASFVSFPAAYLEDINFDGIKDLLVSPNRSANILFTPSNFQKSSWMYENTGVDAPNFEFNSSNFLQSNMIDHGNNTSVAFADEDGDGNLDMLVTSQGQFQQFLGYVSTISLYRNVGTKISPEFELDTEDYLGLSASQFSDMKLQIIDVNADNKLDLIIAATSLNTNTHSVYFLLNNSASRLDFTGEQSQRFNIQLFSHENPYFFDVNQDDLIDLLVGKSDGKLFYFKNSGTKEAPEFQLETESFYNIAQSFTNRNLALTVADLDNDTDLDLITTDGSGKLTIYESFLSHLDAPREGITDNYFNNTTNTLSAFRLGIRTLPTVADLYNSGVPEIVLGTIQGGIQILKNTDEAPPKVGDPNNLLTIFPNPGTVNENNGIIEIASTESLSVKIISALGKEIYSSVPITPSSNLQLPIDNLPSGMYLVIGERNGEIVDQDKFIITD